MWVNKSECRRLYEHDSNLMFGCAAPYGEPWIVLIRLMPRHEVGGDDINTRVAHFTIVDIPNFIRLQNKDGNIATAKDMKGMVPTIAGWPGQTCGNAAVQNGDYVSWLKYSSKPKYEIKNDYKETVRAAGRAQDRVVKDAAAEMTDFKNHLQKKSSANTKVITKDEYAAHMKSGIGQQIEKIRQNDFETTNEYRYLKNNGLL